MRTRIKICGLTREQDVDAAVEAGADALGFVFYAASPRKVSPVRAAQLIRRLPPFVSAVGLFVNEEAGVVRAVLDQVPLALLQFHGDEDEAYCRQFGQPYLKAARMRPGVDLLEFARAHPTACALLLDTWAEGYGGSGQTFDWSLIPKGIDRPIVLSGGLHAGNVGAAVIQLRPYAVDVSSGVEVAKGIKDADKMAAFVAAVKEADARK